MEGKGSFFILLFIVAFLSLTLAVLAGYVFFVGGSSQKTAVETTQKEATKKVPEAETLMLPLFDKKYLNLKPLEDKKLSVIQLGVKVTFYKGKLAEEAAKKNVEPYLAEMKDEVSTYFSNISIEEARNQEEAKVKAKKDLLEKFNKMIPADEKTKQKAVIAVIFDEWFTQ